MRRFRLLLFCAVFFAVALSALVLLGRGEGESGDGPIAAVDYGNEALIARGEYLATAGNCSSCHTAPGGEFLAGGLPFATPFGTVFSTNITPDVTTGIGGWNDWDFLNAMRHGLRPSGEHLYPVFPYMHFTRITNEDLAALFAWLRSVAPIVQDNRGNELAFPFSQRALLGGWKLLFFEPGPWRANAAHGETWNRGAYLVEGLAHCSACHSPRNVLGAERTAAYMAGGELVDPVGEEGALRPWSAPNLTSSDRGLGLWSDTDLRAYLTTGRNEFLESFGPMNEVIMNSTRHLRGDDIAAMAAYLASLPAHDPPAAPEPDALTMGRGRTVYNLHCGTCHLPTGEGDPEMGPRLNRGSLVVQDANPASMINAILYGPEPPHGLPQRWREPMEEFQYLLDDDEVAAVATFVRNSWGNQAGPVTAADVARQR